MASSSTITYTSWLALADSELTVESVHEHLDSLPDDLWVAAACYDRLVNDVEVQEALLDVGLQRTSQAVHRFKDALHLPESTFEPTHFTQHPAALTYFQDLPVDAQLCRLHGLMLQRQYRLITYVEMCRDLPNNVSELTEEDAEWEDDPWAESSGGQRATASQQCPNFPIPLPSFLSNDLIQSACRVALEQLFSSLRALLERHGSHLWPYRFTIYDAFPAHVDPAQYRDFLPRVSSTGDEESASSWRSADFHLDGSILLAFNASNDALGFDSASPLPKFSFSVHDKCLTSADLSSWYRRRVEDIMASTGIIDFALAVIQHGGSQGIPGLDELGEDLSLLTRLVYDAPGASEGDEEWTLARWSKMEPQTIIRAYTLHSTPESLPEDILHLVMPYLYVLESRAERAGSPNPRLHTDLLYEFILDASLERVASIFEASKPTSPASQRVIRDDEDMARLALACLYGNNSLDEWPTMSRIFECLPAWDMSTYEDYDEDVADTTIASLGDFVTPTIARPRCTPSDLMIFFKPLPISSLSRALDILDVHLESGEILSRWNVPAPFSWFLQSRDNESEQRAWANRMARRAGSSGKELETMEDWEWLLEDMVKLAGKGDTGLRGAFGLLPVKEVIRIFFSGLLSSGRKHFLPRVFHVSHPIDSGFDIAKSMLIRNQHVASLTPQIIADLCLTASHEFYDNASSGNYKVGDMKSAYDWWVLYHFQA